MKLTFFSAEKKDEEKYLAAQAALGDQNAFTILVERYRRYIYVIACKITLHEEDALDVTQEVFQRLALHIGDWQGRGSLRAWVATITTRAALDLLRRQTRRREQPMEPDILAPRDHARNLSTSSGGSRSSQRCKAFPRNNARFSLCAF